LNSLKRPIFHIITRLEPGGSAQNVIDSVVSQAGERKVLLIAGPHKGRERLTLGPAATFRYLEIPSLVREISPINDIRTFLALKDEISAFNPAIVHTHTAKAGILGRWAAWLHNLRAGRQARAVIVHTPHGHVFYGYFGPVKTLLFKIIERLTACVTDHFIALTDGERRESVEQGLGPVSKWTVIHSGIRFRDRLHENIRGQLGITADETVITVVARLEPVKGVEYLIRAAGELQKKDLNKKLRFLLVGDGSLKAGLIVLAGKLGLGKAMIFTGFQCDVFKYLAATDIYAQPSLNEAMGRTVIEAQYMGLPVIASRVCGLPDTVREGATGLLVPPGDPGALAGAIETLLRDDGMRRRMGEAAKRRVLEKDFTGYTRFSEESMNIRLKNFYNRILEPGAR
jgi:glycosyltransferase involved in cell wall biosynthesis